jgi:hypothetical protein
MNFHAATQIVEQAARRMRWAALALGVCWWLVTALGIWLGLFVLDNLLGLPAGLRLPLAIAGLLVSTLGFVRHVWAPATRRLKPEQVAVALEGRYQVPENLLINAYQFQHQPLRREEEIFVQRMLRRCDEVVQRVRLADLWEPRRLRGWTVGAALIVGAWVTYVALFPALALNAGRRFVRPLGDVPPASAAQLQVTPEEDLTVVEGADVEVRLAVTFNDEPRVSAKNLPVIYWRENDTDVPATKTGNDFAVFNAVAKQPWTYQYTFADVRRSFAFRVFGFDTYTRSLRVHVQPLPRRKGAECRLTPPSYTGLKPAPIAGPPATIAGLPGSQLEMRFDVQPAVAGVTWADAGQTTALAVVNGMWTGQAPLELAGPYAVAAGPVVLARGTIRLESDNAPEVDFVTEDRNRFAAVGGTVKLEVQARDDYGLRTIQITARPAEQESAPVILKTWTYIGPPGNPGPVREPFVLTVDPERFAAGQTYLIEALAGDFCPQTHLGKSRPIVLRIRSAADYTLTAGDPLTEAFEYLKRTAVIQEQANGLTGNLRAQWEEAVAKKNVPRHVTGISDRQSEARRQGQRALELFRKLPDGKSYAATLGPLVDGEMPWVLRDLAKVTGTQVAALDAIQSRQDYILNTLLSLLGQIAEARKEKPPVEKVLKTEQNAPLVTAAELMKDLHDDLQKFAREQEKILERSKTLMDKRPEDLTQEEEKILGELAREEASWSKFFEEKLTDFAKLPQQDFADASLAKELNEVFQEVQKAAKSLYEKKVELAVPQEQAGLENAKELIHNLEKWMTNKPDYQKWLMEEAPAPADIALAELPAELEDIVGELLDKEKEMSDDIEDVTSSWLDSLDKGAGWDAMDGPISSMSAKGVTGNLLPNEMEIGGRSGEGRTGRSSGQMVEETAEGKGGRETPTRLTPSPFEQGSVKDSDTKSQGGATGGGKLSGFAPEGLRGPTPPPSGQAAPRLAEQQAKLRQQAEALALKLRQYKLPTGDLEASVQAMKRVEQSLAEQDGLGVRRAYSRAVDALQDAKQTVKAESSLMRERTKLPAWMRDEINTGLQDGAPRGYEEMVGEYFRQLAEGVKK